MREELGDLLFSCVNVSRKLGLDGEAMLRHASSKFERRVRAMERFASEQGAELEDLTGRATRPPVEPGEALRRGLRRPPGASPAGVVRTSGAV